MSPIINGLDRQYLNILLRAGQEGFSGSLKALDEAVKFFKELSAEKPVVQKKDGNNQSQGKQKPAGNESFIAPVRPEITNISK